MPSVHFSRRPLAYFGGLYSVFVASQLSSAAVSQALGDLAYFGIYLGFVISLIIRATTPSTHRKAWARLSIGFAFNITATMYETIVLIPGGTETFPSIADAGWLMIYPFAIATAVTWVKIDAGSLPATTWFDGAITTLGLSAVVTALALGVLIDAKGGDNLAVAVALAYPIGDALLIGMMVGSLALGGRRASPMWATLLVGVAIYAMSDLAFMANLSGGNIGPTTGVQITWLLAVCVLALACWASAEPVDRPPDETPSSVVIALPILFAVLSVTVITAGSFTTIPTAATVLAALTLTLVVFRTTFSFQQASALGAALGEARTDDLTHLANRRSFYEELTERTEQRSPEASISLVLLDLKRFKEINDAFGHEAGDRILERVGVRINDDVRSTDFVARLNGDQFIVVVDGDLTQAKELAHRLHGTLTSRPFDIGHLSAAVDVRFGISTCPEHSDTIDRLVRQADQALLTGKTDDHAITVYKPGSDLDLLKRAETVKELQRDVSTGAMVLHYQPKLSLVSRRITGAEALVRWQHPTRGLLYPDEFLHLIEQNGLMQQLTRNVLSTALRDAVEWHRMGLELVVSVNLSPSDLRTPDFAGLVRGLLAEHELPGSCLQLELTEDLLMNDPELGRRVLTELRSLGVTVSIDDFGTGYSSLAYLEHLPVDELKLDRSFVMQLDSNENSAPIVKSTIGLAHALGLSFVAEGVETESALERLTVWGCDTAQGYFISRPVAFDDVTAHIRKNHDVMQVPLEISR